ncbi:hypothetical protein P5673_019674 [Acropora cervicornis]|uniref:Uncharacterized protein n=1 Tax=Acropora cervicornis TaxID=6130 RepID=A0AAD9QBD6_ACRCE|nr:hypothetical protein P5673_019674 [Acropora cervicornis]
MEITRWIKRSCSQENFKLRSFFIASVGRYHLTMWHWLATFAKKFQIFQVCLSVSLVEGFACVLHMILCKTRKGRTGKLKIPAQFVIGKGTIIKMIHSSVVNRIYGRDDKLFPSCHRPRNLRIQQYFVLPKVKNSEQRLTLDDSKTGRGQM